MAKTINRIGIALLFLGSCLQVFGQATVPMTAVAAATTYTVVLDGTKTPAAMLPMTFDQSMYNTFLATGKLPNNNTITPAMRTPPRIQFLMETDLMFWNTAWRVAVPWPLVQAILIALSAICATP